MFDNNCFYNLKKRSLIRINGKDKFSFLQGIISNDIHILKENNSIYSSILTPQGRFIADFFVTNYKESLLLEVHESYKDIIIGKLQMYKLRSDVEISTCKDFYILLISKFSNDFYSNVLNTDLLYFDDPRFNNYFKRLYLFKGLEKNIFDEIGMKEISTMDFNELRFENVIPDFHIDVLKNKSLLMEMRFDDLNGISWTKGCYMGQEITARMKYRNLMKRNLFQIKIDFNSNIEDSLNVNDKEIGHITSHNKKNGFAYINLNYFKEYGMKTLLCGDSKIKILEPWWKKDI